MKQSNTSAILTLAILMMSLTPTFAMLFDASESFGKIVVSRSSNKGIREQLAQNRFITTRYDIQRPEWICTDFSLKKYGRSASEIFVYYATTEETDARFLYLKLENDRYMDVNSQTLTIKCAHPPFFEYLYVRPNISQRLGWCLETLYSETFDIIKNINHKNTSWRHKIKAPEFRTHDISPFSKMFAYMGGYTSAPWSAELTVRFDDRVYNEAAIPILERVSDKMELPNCLKQRLIQPFQDECAKE